MMAVQIRVMTSIDYDKVYDLWIHTPGMGLNTTDDSKEGIEKYLKRNRPLPLWRNPMGK